MDVQFVEGNLLVTVGRTEASEAAATWVEQQLLLPHAYVQRLFREGRVRAGGRPLPADARLSAGKRIWLLGDARTDAADPVVRVSEGALNGESTWLRAARRRPADGETPEGDEEPAVLFADPHLVVVDKPAGWLVHDDQATETPVLQAWLRAHLAAAGASVTPTHAHRLDRDTTGCVLFAKHPFAARALDAMLQRRKVHRMYLALVHGRPPQARGSVECAIGRDRHVNGRFRVSRTGVPAVTHYRVLATSRDGQVSAVACQLETGRRHQIRVHLQALGCPLVGDPLYTGTTGGRTGPGMRMPSTEGGWTGRGQALHAWSIAWVHPYTREALWVQAPLPAAFQRAIHRLSLRLPDAREVADLR
ncbi:MAG: RluA family pseudouridine synthase [Alicyclobacillus sp.]|nr:RluA family pseudouridine synthase [Alicyclobacillus sp.]